MISPQPSTVGTGLRLREALVKADISRFKRIIENGLRSRTDQRRATEVAIAVNALNRMLDLGRPEYAAYGDNDPNLPDCDRLLTHTTEPSSETYRSKHGEPLIKYKSRAGRSDITPAGTVVSS